MTESMTEEQIYQAALTEWTGILAQLWTAIGKPVEQDRLRIYRDQLKSIPLGLLELSISRVMREETWNTVPAVGRVWEAVRKELGNPHDLNYALQEWRPIYHSRQEQSKMFL